MFIDQLGKTILFFDGGMGTLLQEQGLKPGELPEEWNLTHREAVIQIHRSYVEAGSDILLTNTFGANALKFHSKEHTLEEVISAAVANAREGARLGSQGKRDVYIAFDIGPTGKLLKPLGDLEFERACEVFREAAMLGERAGADLIHIETMSDTYEVKAAVLAARESTSLPVMVTLIFDSHGKLLTGGDIPSVTALLEGLRVDAIGLNCGLGPKEMLPLLKELRQYTSLPIVIKPNAGLPVQRNGETCYDVTPEEFAGWMEQIVDNGACVIGGCCGTTPEHIRAMAERCRGRKILRPEKKNHTIVSSYGKAVIFREAPLIIGERINPTGKKKLKKALKDGQMDYILDEAAEQEDCGAHILDINVGLPGIDEPSMMMQVIQEVQGITNLPLQIDTVDEKAMEAAMRIYNGKPMINSVNGKQASMDMVFPLIKKYGGVVVALTLDEKGIPQTAEGRADIAGWIIKEAEKYGIERKDIIVDVLTMAVSADPEGARITLDALRLVRERYHVHTVLGVSNISFGLPNRPLLNANFFTMAMQAGLSAGIINPASEMMMQAYRSFRALMHYDEDFTAYIDGYGERRLELTDQERISDLAVKGDSESKKICAATQPGEWQVQKKDVLLLLQHAIQKGLKEEAGRQTKECLRTKAPMDIISEGLVPALDTVGKGFENGTVFLPQLLMSAEAAKQAFAILKETLPEGEADNGQKPRIILATVKGDIHDIGKNIVKVLLENYGFAVIDLGKDVPPETIVETAVQEDVKLAGLSALMTTTVPSMEKTIRLLNEKKPDCKVMVGGAVLNQEYADSIHADFYGKDAMQSVYYAKELFGI